MSKVKMLLDVVRDMRSLTDSIEAVANVMADNQTQLAKKADTVKAEPVPDKKKYEPKVTLEQVRTVLARKSNDGFTAEVRELLKKYGAERLSQVDESNYAALMADAEVLGNAT